MSRSIRKTPIACITTGISECNDKMLWHTLWLTHMNSLPAANSARYCFHRFSAFISLLTWSMVAISAAANGAPPSSTPTQQHMPAMAFVADAQACVYGAYFIDILRSCDSGRHWLKIDTGIDEEKLSAQSLGLPFIANLAVAKTGTVYAAIPHLGILKSWPPKAPWQLISNDIGASSFHTLAIDRNDCLFAGTNHGIFRSCNAGKSWTPQNHGLPEGKYLVYATDSGTRVWAFCIDDYNSAGVAYKAVTDPNGNLVWEEESAGMRNARVANPFYYGSTTPIVEHGGNIYVAASAGLFKKPPAGPWLQLSDPYTSNPEDLGPPAVSDPPYIRQQEYQSLAIARNGDLYVGTEKGLYLSKDDGHRWETVSAKLGEQSIQSLFIDRSDILYVVTGRGFKRYDTRKKRDLE